MSGVGIVVDSASCVPPELLKELDIRVGPVNLIIDGKNYRDQVDITNEEFFAMQKTVEDIPSTTGVNPEDFANIFRDLAGSTNDILCLPISEQLSVTYDSAIKAREIVQKEIPGINIEIIDTNTATGAEGWVGIAAARASRAGKSMAEVVAVANDIIPKVKWILAMDTLKYLVKGGRAPKYAGLMADLIQMKPLIGMMKNTGKVEPLGRTRTKNKAHAMVVRLAKEYIGDRPAHVNVHYADNLEEGERFRDLVISELNCAEVYMTCLTPVMCCHTGPMVGLSFYAD